MKRVRNFWLAVALVAVGCSQDLASSAGIESASARSATRPAPVLGPNPWGSRPSREQQSSLILAAAPAASQHSGVPPTPAASTVWAETESLLQNNTHHDAFKALDLMSAELGREKVDARLFCYHALLYFTLNQLTAGKVEADRCLATLSVGKRATWKTRLDAANQTATQRVEDTLTQVVKEKCGQAVAKLPGGIGTCRNCLPPERFREYLDRLKTTDTPAASALKLKLAPRTTSASTQSPGSGTGVLKPGRNAPNVRP